MRGECVASAVVTASRFAAAENPHFARLFGGIRRIEQPRARYPRSSACITFCRIKKNGKRKFELPNATKMRTRSRTPPPHAGLGNLKTMFSFERTLSRRLFHRCADRRAIHANDEQFGANQNGYRFVSTALRTHSCEQHPRCISIRNSVRGNSFAHLSTPLVWDAGRATCAICARHKLTLKRFGFECARRGGSAFAVGKRFPNAESAKSYVEANFPLI